ncbi:hypothetical protein [Caryophanon tenue]|uniref:Uncharacterized protein n=1 Tax=Caryophanon tenue TaxID=33978 RepID=A0A1C0Y556_9BACL|nr:hypothetical protein [Caryophanon tenue]OCS82265.1 hypothetical protein A6M13_07465 [Caryophanon tenue]
MAEKKLNVINETDHKTYKVTLSTDNLSYFLYVSAMDAYDAFNSIKDSLNHIDFIRAERNEDDDKQGFCYVKSNTVREIFIHI